MYSVVNKATSVIPNQAALEIFQKVGTVTSVDMMIDDVMNICTTKADTEEVGCSGRAQKTRFHRGPGIVFRAYKVTLALRL